MGDIVVEAQLENTLGTLGGDSESFSFTSAAATAASTLSGMEDFSLHRSATEVYNKAVSNFGFCRSFLLIDCRDRKEYMASHIKGAVHINDVFTTAEGTASIPRPRYGCPGSRQSPDVPLC